METRWLMGSDGHVQPDLAVWHDVRPDQLGEPTPVLGGEPVRPRSAARSLAAGVRRDCASGSAPTTQISLQRSWSRSAWTRSIGPSLRRAALSACGPDELSRPRPVYTPACPPLSLNAR